MCVCVCVCVCVSGGPAGSRVARFFWTALVPPFLFFLLRLLFSIFISLICLSSSYCFYPPSPLRPNLPTDLKFTQNSLCLLFPLLVLLVFLFSIFLSSLFFFSLPLFITSFSSCLLHTSLSSFFFFFFSSTSSLSSASSTFSSSLTSASYSFRFLLRLLIHHLGLLVLLLLSPHLGLLLLLFSVVSNSRTREQEGERKKERKKERMY